MNASRLQVPSWLGAVIAVHVLSSVASVGASAAAENQAATAPPAVRAVDFESREIYRSAGRPGYTSWVSFFPGERGQWYITCEEVTRPAKPPPQATLRQWYEMGLPRGYDKSQYLMEMVILRSDDDMRTWRVVSRTPGRFHHSAGSFAQARTTDGRFLRFVWSVYSLDPTNRANEIFYTSDDDGRTWQKMPPFTTRRLPAIPTGSARSATGRSCWPCRWLRRSARARSGPSARRWTWTRLAA